MDINELLKYQPEKAGGTPVASGNKRKVPMQLEKRPKMKKLPAAEDASPYQFKRILKKEPVKETPKVQAPPPQVETTKKIRKNELTEEEKERLLELVAEDGNEEVMDGAAVKRYILAFEKKVTKNQEARVKFPDQPQRFMESEIELHDEIHKLHVLATVPEHYDVIAKLSCITTLLGLLTHENADIAIAVLDLLQEMTDPYALGEVEDTANVLIDALISGHVTAVLVQCLQRLDERVKEEADGVHNTLAIIENIAECNSDVCKYAGEQGLLTWLLKRIKRRSFDNNKLYASEILAILLQQEESNRVLMRDVNGVDTLLQALALYKGHNPNNQEELEYMENMFNCLCSCLLLSDNKELFLKGEGLQLMILMLREKKMSRTSALKCLAYAMTGEDGGENCHKFVEILGLRSVFPLFMKPTKRNKKSGHGSEESEEHTCSIISSLFRHLNSNNRQRLIHKFIEDDHIKLDRLMEMYFKYQRRVQDADARIEREKDDLEEQGELVDESMEEEFYLRRLDAGLFVLQLLVCIMLEACSAGVSSIKQRVLTLLGQQGGAVKQIKQVMREYASHLGDATSADPEDSVEVERRRLISLVDRF